MTTLQIIGIALGVSAIVILYMVFTIKRWIDHRRMVKKREDAVNPETRRSFPVEEIPRCRTS